MIDWLVGSLIEWLSTEMRGALQFFAVTSWEDELVPSS